jgi:hypothetical protein
MKRRFFSKMAVITAVFTVYGMSAQDTYARDPFRSPAASPDMYDYQTALQELQLRGLFVTSAGSRAVIYHYNDDRVQVVSPNDEVTVNLEGLQHKYRISGIGGRAVLMTGADSKTYRIGIEERGSKK